MMMCERCGSVFFKPILKGSVKPVYSILDVTDPERRLCPNCASEDIANAHICPVCGEYTSSSDVCAACAEKLGLLADRAHKKADELYFDLIAEYSCGNAAAYEYMEYRF